jgi:uncharacterized SAM-binding protein YcdF (DUF218 family)
MRWERMWQAVGLIGVAVFFVSAFSPLPNLLYRWSVSSSDVQPADAIVVLGSSMGENGVLDCESLRRAIRGMTLYRANQAPLIVLSGTKLAAVSEGEVRAELARALGIPSGAILVEEGAFTTREEATRVGATLRGRNVRRILLVTDPQHLRRARVLFEREGLQVLPVAAESSTATAKAPEERLRLMRETLAELLARVYYRAAGYI